jgi:hypothetical protein
MAEREERIGLNETLFREVNERVKDINESFRSRIDQAEFVCECGDDSCTERVRMTLSEYDELRSESTHFVVRPGHEIPNVESVVLRREGYIVVEKKPGPAAAMAKETDPRS